VSEQDRNLILKIGLWLMLMEGWATAASVRLKFGTSDPAPVTWLLRHGFVQQGAGSVVRWNSPTEFESLWSHLIPERPCPMRLRAGVVVHKL
jgi:hypothetical protein